MNANQVITVDVGDNIAKILAVIADKLGTTTEKIFEIYTKQAYLEGWTMLVACLIALVLFAVLTWYFSRKAEFGNDGPNVAFILSFCTIVCLGVSLLVSLCIAKEITTKILNPEAYAITEISNNVRSLKN